MDKTAVVSLADAIGWLTPLFGVGGITAIVIAWLGTRKPVPAAAAPQPMAGFQALLADHVSMERFSNDVRRLAQANERLGESNERIADGIERYCNLQDISQALDRLPPQPQRRRRRREPE